MISNSLFYTLGRCVAVVVGFGIVRSFWKGYEVTLIRVPLKHVMKLLGVIPKGKIPDDRACYIHKIKYNGGANLYPLMWIYKKILLKELKDVNDEAMIISKFINMAKPLNKGPMLSALISFETYFLDGQSKNIQNYRQFVRDYFRNYFASLGMVKYDPDFSTSGFSGRKVVNYKEEKAKWDESLRCHHFVFRYLDDVGVCDRNLSGGDIVKVLAKEGYELVRDQRDGAFVVYGDVVQDSFRAKHFAILKDGKAISKFGQCPFIQHDIDNIPDFDSEYRYGKYKLFFRKVI